MKSVSCVIPLSYVNSVINAPNVVTNLPVGARLQNLWRKWLDLGASPKVVQILKEGYTLPFRIRSNLSRIPPVISCYGNPHRNLKLLEALHQLIDKNAIELVHKQTSLGFFNQLFLVPKTQQQMEADLRSKQSEPFPKDQKIQDGDTGNHQDLTPIGRVGNLHRLQGRLLPYSDTGSIQEIPETSYTRPNLSIQSTTIWPINSAHGVHCNSQGGKTDGHSEGYKDPPIPRRLVGESHIPPGLSPTYTGFSGNVPGSRLDGELREVGTGTKASFQLCRLPVRPRVRSGPTDTGPVAETTRKNTGTACPSGVFGKGVHVLDRPINSHGKAGSPRQITHEAHSMAFQKQLENTGIPRKGDSSTQVFTSPFTMVATGKQCPHRPTITPHATCSANLYRRIKRRVGRSLKRVHCPGKLVPTGKQATHKLSGAQSSFSSLKRVSRSMRGQNGSCSNRQHHGSSLYQQGRGYEVRPTVCPTMENLDLVFQKTSNSESQTHPRPLKCSGGQTVQTGSDHPNRMVPPSRGFSSPVQQVAPASNRSLCYEIQQQVAPVCITSSGSHGHCSGRTQFVMGESGRVRLPTDSHIGQSGGEVAGLPIPKVDHYCPGVAQHDMVLGPSGNVQSDPITLASTAKPIDPTLQSGPSQESDKPKSP